MTLNGRPSSSVDTCAHCRLLSLVNWASILLDSGEVASNIYMYIQIDINGKSAPNTWGKDYFEFTYTPTTGLVPSGHPSLGNSYKSTVLIQPLQALLGKAVLIMLLISEIWII
jgi:hypothetical protein